MTAPTAPVLPPVTVPANVLKAISLLLVIAGPVAAVAVPGVSSAAAKALVILGFLFVGAAIFTVHTVLAAVHANGFSKLTLEHVVTAEEQEFKSLWPEAKQQLDVAKPALDKLQGAGGLDDAWDHIEALTQRVEATAANVPQVDQDVVRAAVKEALSSLLTPTAQVPPPPVVEPPASTEPVPAQQAPPPAA